MNRVALVCIAKNEDYYLEEWVNYNLKLGFDHIFIYMNDWRTLFVHPKVTKIPFDGNIKQLHAYNSFRVTYKDQYDWVAYFDCDEFLYLQKHNSIQELIKDYENSNAIAINCYMFGSDNKVKRESNSLLKTFTKRDKNVNEHIKVIVNMGIESTMTLPHNLNIPATDTNNNLVKGPFNYGGPTDVCYISHFYRKTYDDWLLRCDRGRADSSLKSTPNEWLETINEWIDVEDINCKTFLYNDAL